jgi:hypothetical protein
MIVLVKYTPGMVCFLSQIENIIIINLPEINLLHIYSMERDGHVRHIPFCETRVPLVDQYMWPEKDTTERICHNGVSHPVYACNGVISRTLPLDMYPKVNEVHPEIRMSSQPHFGIRDPRMGEMVDRMQRDIAEKRLEGMYIGNMQYDAYARMKFKL